MYVRVYILRPAAALYGMIMFQKISDTFAFKCSVIFHQLFFTSHFWIDGPQEVHDLSSPALDSMPRTPVQLSLTTAYFQV